MKPQRITLSRAKGWKLPENTVVVSRPSKWGNPFTIQFCREWFGCSERDARQRAKILFEHWITRALPDENWTDKIPPTIEDIRRELCGKNLACWCKPGHLCHADVLLELANK